LINLTKEEREDLLKRLYFIENSDHVNECLDYLEKLIEKKVNENIDLLTIDEIVKTNFLKTFRR
jgi:hypothetical protein